MLYFPSVPNNIETLQVFNDNHHIQSFMGSKRIFLSQEIEEEQAQQEGNHQVEEDELIDGIL